MSSSPIVSVLSDLRSVRENYKKQLETIAEYAAFLRVERTTVEVGSVLKASVSSSASMSNDVTAALELAQERFREHLTSVPAYRALLAIEKLIANVEAELTVDTPEVSAVSAASEQPIVAAENTTLSNMRETAESTEQPAKPSFIERVESVLAGVASQSDRIELPETPPAISPPAHDSARIAAA
ncbi:MAG: hypothetical protein AB1342_07355 [Pseudomonadota bacterium]